MPERRQCTAACLLAKLHWTCSEPLLGCSHSSSAVSAWQNWLLVDLDSISFRCSDTAKMLHCNWGRRAAEARESKAEEKVCVIEETNSYTGWGWPNAISCQSHLHLMCGFRFIHWVYHSVAGILLRLWSLYVFAHVIVTTPEQEHRCM